MVKKKDSKFHKTTSFIHTHEYRETIDFAKPKFVVL
jgi:hypothetical protein